MRRLRMPRGDEVGRVAEDEPARAEVDLVRRGDEPHAEAADDADDERHERDAREAAERDRGAHGGERHGVRDEVAEADVQERRREDLEQPRGVARVDAVVVERRAGRDVVDGLERPHEHDHRERRAAGR